MPDHAPRGAPAAAPYPAELLAWRPQQARQPRVLPAISDPILEPSWAGQQVLAHVDLARGGDATPWLRFIDQDGDDLTAVFEELAGEVAQAVAALDAVIDGWLTIQATHGGEGALVTPVFKPSTAAFLTGRPGQLVTAELPPVANPVTAFVAVDLLRVDGESLLDVPLLERKRLLDGVLRPGERVRVTPFARPPVSQWLLTWKASGFSGAVLKAANGRYEPGQVAHDWAYVAAPEGRQR